MPYRITPFITNDFYHIYNRGVNKQTIFSNNRDYSRFIQTLSYYQIQNPKPKFSLYRASKIFPIDFNKKIVEIVCFCLMPNHFHLLLKQNKDGGITEFMRKFIHSYTKYRNIKYQNQGPIFRGIFKAVRIESDEQLIHVSRYIHLNPLVSSLIKNLELYPWSSYPTYIDLSDISFIKKDDVFNFFKSSNDYKKFVLERSAYGTSLEILKHKSIDYDD